MGALLQTTGLVLCSKCANCRVHLALRQVWSRFQEQCMRVSIFQTWDTLSYYLVRHECTLRFSIAKVWVLGQSKVTNSSCGVIMTKSKEEIRGCCYGVKEVGVDRCPFPCHTWDHFKSKPRAYNFCFRTSMKFVRLKLYRYRRPVSVKSSVTWGREAREESQSAP